MMRISSCIEMMFQDYNFYERFEAVKRCGIQAAEFWKWSNKDIDRIADIVREKNVKISIFNMDSKDEQLSYRLSGGILNDGNEEDFLSALEESIPVYKKLNAKAMIVLIGEKKKYNQENVYSCLKASVPILEDQNINLLVEPINSFDRKEYAMPYAGPVFEMMRRLSNPHIKLLYDVYHQNVMGDYSMQDIRRNIDMIGHFHVADVPGRHEPGTGNVDYKSLLKEIDSLGYEGYVGLEYSATKKDEETLGFIKEYLNA